MRQPPQQLQPKKAAHEFAGVGQELPASQFGKRQQPTAPVRVQTRSSAAAEHYAPRMVQRQQQMRTVLNSPSASAVAQAPPATRELAVATTLDSGATRVIASPDALSDMTPSDTTFLGVGGKVSKSAGKGTLRMSLIDAYDSSKSIDLNISGAEGVPGQTDVLFSLVRVVAQGGRVVLEAGKSTLTIGGDTIRIRDDCQLSARVTVPVSSKLAANAWMFVPPGKRSRRTGQAMGATAAAKNGQ
jgi:hypothetical protein